MSVTLPANPSRRSISAAANPAAPPPTITTRSGFALELRALPAVRLSAGSIFSRTNAVPLCFSTRQHGIGLKAGAATASPVRRLADNQSVGERAAVMRTSRADREQFVAMAREQHGVVAHMPAHHAAIGNVINGHAAGEIRPFWLGLLSAHGNSYDRR